MFRKSYLYELYIVDIATIYSDRLLLFIQIPSSDFCNLEDKNKSSYANIEATSRFR